MGSMGAGTAIPLFGSVLTGTGALLNKDEEEVMHTMQTPRMTSQQMALLKELSNVLRGQLGGGITGYEDQVTEELTPTQREAITRITPTGKTGLDYLDEIMSRGPEAERDYWQMAFVNPAKRVFEKELVPSILEKFASMDAVDSGASRRAISEGAADLSSELGAKLADIMYTSQMYKTQIPGQEMSLISQILGAGEAERSNQQAINQEAYQRWQQEQPWANPWLQYLGIPLGVQPYDVGYYSKLEGGSKWGKALMTAGNSMMGMGGMMGGGGMGGGGYGSGLNFYGASAPSGGYQGPQMYSMQNPGWYAGWTVG